MPLAAVSTVTRNRTCAESPGFKVPPVLASAPAPTRATTCVPSNSATSSPAASVRDVPSTTIEPGTYVVFGGITSTTVLSRAPSLPVLVNVSAYSRTSPATASPPSRSVTVLVIGGELGHEQIDRGGEHARVPEVARRLEPDGRVGRSVLEGVHRGELVDVDRQVVDGRRRAAQVGDTGVADRSVAEVGGGVRGIGEVDEVGARTGVGVDQHLVTLDVAVPFVGDRPRSRR